MEQYQRAGCGALPLHFFPVRDYRKEVCCPLQIMNRSRCLWQIHIENWVFNDPRPVLFDTLEEAQAHAFKYMDTLRAREAAEAEKIKEKLRNYAHVQTITREK